MRRLVSRFDCYPSDFLNGVLGLTADQIATYTIIMMLQYDRGGPVLVRAREREIAIRAGLTVGRLTSSLEHLLKVGKLVSVDEDHLENPRASREIEKIEQKLAENRENSAKGGNSNRLKWERKRNEINKTESRPAIRPDSQNIALLPPPSLPTEEDDPSDHCPKPDKPVRTRNAYSSDFEEWWDAYPTDKNMPKGEAYKVWKRLSEVDRQDALASLPSFNRYCQSRPDYRPVHAARYLSQRRWEGHLKVAEATSKRVRINQGSPQWDAWAKYRRSRKMSMPVDDKGGWSFESEWPPRDNAREHARSSA